MALGKLGTESALDLVGMFGAWGFRAVWGFGAEGLGPSGLGLGARHSGLGLWTGRLRALLVWDLGLTPA